MGKTRKLDFPISAKHKQTQNVLKSKRILGTVEGGRGEAEKQEGTQQHQLDQDKDLMDIATTSKEY